MMGRKHVFCPLFLATLAFTALMSACAPAGPSVDQKATVSVLSTRISATATAAAAADSGPATSGTEPTPGSTPAASQGTASTKATEPVLNQQVTQTVESAQASQANQATREAERPILAELPMYGVDTNKGKVAWIQGPLTLEAEGYNAFKADNKFPGTVVKDFVISSNITWNTKYGDSGCGFVIRTDGDDNKPSQYLIAMTRFANGHIGFAVISKGEIVNGTDLYPKQEDNHFNAQNDATNELTIVGRGTKFQIYTNRVLIGEVDADKDPVMPKLPPAPQPPADKNDAKAKATYEAAQAQYQQQVGDIQAQYNERLKNAKTANKDFLQGFVTMVAVTQSGKTNCTFDNTWLWLIED
jgi:hypothetical protein